MNDLSPHDIILTLKQVEQIRKLANTPGVTHQSVAKQFGIDVGHVAYIANRNGKGVKK